MGRDERGGVRAETRQGGLERVDMLEAAAAEAGGRRFEVVAGSPISNFLNAAAFFFCCVIPLSWRARWPPSAAASPSVDEKTTKHTKRFRTRISALGQKMSMFY